MLDIVSWMDRALYPQYTNNWDNHIFRNEIMKVLKADYHAQILEGCLDLLNTQSAWLGLYPALAALLVSKTSQMLAWLETMPELRRAKSLLPAALPDAATPTWQHTSAKRYRKERQAG